MKKFNLKMKSYDLFSSMGEGNLFSHFPYSENVNKIVCTSQINWDFSPGFNSHVSNCRRHINEGGLQKLGLL